MIIELLKNIKPDLLKEGKVRLIFPLEDWETSKHIDKNGLVFITSCHGADQLNNLFIASRFLKVRVWGSKGIYNYITNTSEGGFYWCDYEKLKSIDKELKELIYTTRNKAFTSNKWDDFNKLLLDNKICGFSTKSPISWI